MKGHKRYIIDLHLWICHFKFDKSNQSMKNFQPIFNTKANALKVSLLLYFFILRGRKILFLQSLVITLFFIGFSSLEHKEVLSLRWHSKLSLSYGDIAELLSQGIDTARSLSECLPATSRLIRTHIGRHGGSHRHHLRDWGRIGSSVGQPGLSSELGISLEYSVRCFLKSCSSTLWIILTLSPFGLHCVPVRCFSGMCQGLNAFTLKFVLPAW